MASFAQGCQALGVRSGSGFLLEHRREYGKIGAFGCGAEDIGRAVAGDGDEKVVSGQWLVASKTDGSANIARRDVIGA